MHESTTQCVCHSPLIPGFDKENSCDANPQYPILDFQTNFISGKRPSWKGTSVKQLWKIQLLSTKSMNRSRSIATDGPMHEKQSNCVFGEMDKYSFLNKTTNKNLNTTESWVSCWWCFLVVESCRVCDGCTPFCSRKYFPAIFLISGSNFLINGFLYADADAGNWKLMGFFFFLFLFFCFFPKGCFFFTIAKYAKFVFWCQNGNIFRAEYEIGYPKSTPGLVLGRGGGTH